MEKVFTLKVVTPEGPVINEQVTSVILPTVEGQIDVLPGHTSYTSVLDVGLAQYVTVNGEQGAFVLSEGFVDFHNNTLNCLAESADTKLKIETEKSASERGGKETKDYAEKREELKKIINTLSTSEQDRIAATKKLKRIEAIDTLISH